MKVTVIGGGSTYTPELVNGFLSRVGDFPLDELWLMDIAQERLDIVGGFAQRMVSAKGDPFKVILTEDQQAAVQGAAYVITQLRVGMMPARRGDEYLGKRHGLVGQETTGVGGMAKALRTIPVILNIAEDMHQTAPGALLVNFTNPSGLVTEALARYAPQVASVGVCNSAITTKMGIVAGAELKLGTSIQPERAQLDTIGLNHLTWYRGFTLDGEDLWAQVFQEYLTSLRSELDPDWDVHTIESLGMIPNSYLEYFFYTQRKIRSQEQWPPSRAEQVMEIEKDLLRQYADPNLCEPPADLMLRGGAYYSTLATQLLDSHYNNRGQVHVVNIPQRGAVPGLPLDWVMELPCRVGKPDNNYPTGIYPLPARPLPSVCFGLVAQVKTYELLSVEAAVHGDRNAAYQALLTHPLGPSADKVQEVLDDMLLTNQQWLPKFWK